MLMCGCTYVLSTQKLFICGMNKAMSVSDGFSLVVMTVAVLIDLWIVYYLINLERIKCVCALEWRRHFIIGYILVSIVYLVGSTLGAGFARNPIVVTGYLSLSLFNIYVVLSYVGRLERENCKCSDTLARLVLKVVAVVRILVFAMVLVYAVFVAAAVGAVLAKKGKGKGRRVK